MTLKLYLSNTYLMQSSATVLEIDQDDKGVYLVLDQTVFYSQGGGQPSDQGLIIGKDFQTEVIFARYVENEIRHYLKYDVSKEYKKQKIKCLINQERRLLNSRYHTAAHYLGLIVEKIYPNLKAIKGHSFPNEAYIDFQGIEQINLWTLKEIVTKMMTEKFNISIFETDLNFFEKEYYKLSYKVPDNKNFRVMQIQDFLPIPCGGTHLISTSEIGEIICKKIKEKNGFTRLSYELR